MPPIRTHGKSIHLAHELCCLVGGPALQRNIHFRRPNASMRRELFSLHLPNSVRVTTDYTVLAGLSRGLSGGDIHNVCVNSIYAGSTDPNPERCLVTQEMVEREVAKVRKANAEHSGEKEGPKRRIGFGVGWGDQSGMVFEGGGSAFDSSPPSPRPCVARKPEILSPLRLCHPSELLSAPKDLP